MIFIALLALNIKAQVPYFSATVGIFILGSLMKT